MAYLCTSRAGWLAAADCLLNVQISGTESIAADSGCMVGLGIGCKAILTVCGRSGVLKIYKGGRLFRRRRFEEQVPGRILRIDLTSPILPLKAFSIRKGETLYASTHHGAQQGEAARRSSDMRQARHLPQRWYWDIVVQPIDRSGLTPASRLRRSMEPKGTQQEPQTPLSPVRVAAHGKHAGQTQKPVLTLRKTKSKIHVF
ncbi:hypothetical protein TNCV_2986241 [Trichonephila clavipes]|nr:hypothetical protein TNCV_2986241 [Trichonephila clavipes]